MLSATVAGGVLFLAGGWVERGDAMTILGMNDVTAAAHLAPLVDWADLDGNLLVTNDPFVGVTVAGGRLVLPEGWSATPAEGQLTAAPGEKRKGVRSETTTWQFEMPQPIPPYLLALAVVLLDQYTKGLASGALDYGRPVEIFFWFDLTLHHNTGAAFSLLADAGGWQRPFFITIAVVVVLLIAVGVFMRYAGDEPAPEPPPPPPAPEWPAAFPCSPPRGPRPSRALRGFRAGCCRP